MSSMNTDGFQSPLRNSGTLGPDMKPSLPLRKLGAKVSPPSANRSKNAPNLRGMTLNSMDNHQTQPLPYALMPREETQRHLADNETGFLTIGSQAATHQYDVEGTWKKLYTRSDGSDEVEDNSSSSLHMSSSELKKY